MIVTEIEAMTKWCPHIRGYSNGAAINSNSIGDRHSYTCVGRDCMMWRWANMPHDPLDNNPKGFCGLAYNVRIPNP